MPDIYLSYQDRISVDPDVLSGKPVIKGTRIPVELVIERLAQTLDLSSLFADYPRLTENDIKAALEYAKNRIGTGTTEVAIKPSEKKRVDEILSLAGAWGERDWDEVEKDLNRIRHQSKPSPPFVL